MLISKAKFLVTLQDSPLLLHSPVNYVPGLKSSDSHRLPSSKFFPVALCLSHCCNDPTSQDHRHNLERKRVFSWPLIGSPWHPYPQHRQEGKALLIMRQLMAVSSAWINSFVLENFPMSNIQSAELWVSEQGDESEFLNTLINARHLSARQSHTSAALSSAFKTLP